MVERKQQGPSPPPPAQRKFSLDAEHRDSVIVLIGENLEGGAVCGGQPDRRLNSFGRDTEAGKIEQILQTAGSKPMTLQRHRVRRRDVAVLIPIRERVQAETDDALLSE